VFISSFSHLWLHISEFKLQRLSLLLILFLFYFNWIKPPKKPFKPQTRIRENRYLFYGRIKPYLLLFDLTWVTTLDPNLLKPAHCLPLITKNKSFWHLLPKIKVFDSITVAAIVINLLIRSRSYSINFLR
jgi:hypothetical protein